MRRLAVALMLVAAGPFAARPAAAGVRTVIEVFPGPAAIANALALAQPGDVLNIHAGTYPEHVTVSTEDLTLQAAGDGTVTVDGGCVASNTIEVATGGTTIRGLRVIGAGSGPAPKEIDFNAVATGRVLDSSVEDTCGNAEYGVNVYRAGSIQIVRVTATGFSDAGIYVGAIASTPRGPLTVWRSESFGNERGIIVENSAGGRIEVRGNSTHDNATTGIWITNSDGVHVEANVVQDNGQTGIELDPFSDRNLIRGNLVRGHVFDLSNDGGSGNCFLDNVYTTSFGEISC